MLRSDLEIPVQVAKFLSLYLLFAIGFKGGVALAESELDSTVWLTLLAAMGLLTAEHLRLGIATYDPAAYYNAVKDAPLTGVSPQGERLERALRGIGRN